MIFGVGLKIQSITWPDDARVEVGMGVPLVDSITVVQDALWCTWFEAKAKNLITLHNARHIASVELLKEP